jgi:hypothetical protein
MEFVHLSIDEGIAEVRLERGNVNAPACYMRAAVILIGP